MWHSADAYSLLLYSKFTCLWLMGSLHTCQPGDDFSLQSGTLSLTPTSPQATQSLTIIRDGVVLEGREVFELQLHLVSAGQPVSKLVGTKVVIQDTDG